MATDSGPEHISTYLWAPASPWSVCKQRGSSRSSAPIAAIFATADAASSADTQRPMVCLSDEDDGDGDDEDDEDDDDEDDEDDEDDGDDEDDDDDDDDDDEDGSK